MSSEESFYPITWQVLTTKPKQRTRRKHYNTQHNETSVI